MRLVSTTHRETMMMGRGVLALTALCTCVLSLPLTPSQPENEDVKVMKCIVEALADVLSRPHPMPVSQECLVTLKTDDRLISILRHHNFLKELQEIAVQGGAERAQLQRDAESPELQTDVADRSMLEALGGPGERSILSQQQKRRTGNGDGDEGEKAESPRRGESQEASDAAEEAQVTRENKDRPGSHVSSEPVGEWSEDKAEKREEEEGEEKRESSEEYSEESMAKEKKGSGSAEKRSSSKHKSKKDSFEDEDEEKDKRSPLLSHKQQAKREEEEDEDEMKRAESRESPKRWSKRGKAPAPRGKAAAPRLDIQQEVPHHSKEVSGEEEEEEGEKKRDAQRTPEEKELQMIAKRGPEERSRLEEEGSASRKSEEPEIESLAAIESELENVAQKLHEMRRG